MKVVSRQVHHMLLMINEVKLTGENKHRIKIIVFFKIYKII